jgi:hypothetical protein
MKGWMSLAMLVGSALGQGFPLAPPPGPQVYPRAMVEDDAGFVPIFDGETLKGWEGDPRYWRVENHLLTGEVTAETLLKQNNFIIWRGGTPGNFEMKVEYRITAGGNSGVNYRSVEYPGTKYLLKGYQADIDGVDKYTGQNYEERGRTFLAMRGMVSHVTEAGGAQAVASLGTAEELKGFIHAGEWNTYHLIVRGNVLIHMLNGHVMSEVIDDDTAHRRFDGLIGVQVHVGPPMKVEYRRIALKVLP